MTALAMPETVGVTSSTPDVTHLFCCDEDLALCGEDITDLPISYDPDDVLCVVCADLSPAPCAWGCEP